jgi:hypothetical protein
MKLITFRFDHCNEILEPLASNVFQNVTIPVIQWSSISLLLRVRRYAAGKDASLFVIFVEGNARSKHADSVEGIKWAAWGQISYTLSHVIIRLLMGRLKSYFAWLFDLHKEDRLILQKDLELDNEVH